jgi:hypothetical protein
MLFGTAAQESGLRWERQRSPRWDSDVGGFSKWQLEKASIIDSLKFISTRPALAGRVNAFLFDDPNVPLDYLQRIPIEWILFAMRLDCNDKIGVVFARLHYFRVPESIPSSLEDQAAYWKQYYNTPLGAGTPQQYIVSYNRYIKEIPQWKQ